MADVGQFGSPGVARTYQCRRNHPLPRAGGVELKKTCQIPVVSLAVDLSLPAHRDSQRGLEAVLEPPSVLNKSESADHRTTIAAGHILAHSAVPVLGQLRLGTLSGAGTKRLFGGNSNGSATNCPGLGRRASRAVLSRLRPLWQVADQYSGPGLSEWLDDICVHDRKSNDQNLWMSLGRAA